MRSWRENDSNRHGPGEKKHNFACYFRDGTQQFREKGTGRCLVQNFQSYNRAVPKPECLKR